MVERDPRTGDEVDGSGDRSPPLADLADRVRSKAEAEADSSALDDVPGLDGVFQEASYVEPQAGDPWESMDAGSASGEVVESTGEPGEHTVPKRAYCERCEHFSEPPEVSCTHPGTTIVEFPDIDHVRVRNCPVVAERQALGEVELRPMTPRTFGRQ